MENLQETCNYLLSVFELYIHNFPSFSNTEWLTLALVIITGFYAWATFRILRANESVVIAMQSQTEALLRPYVVVYVTPRPRIGTTLVLIEINNKGRSPATGLRLTLDKDFFSHAKPLQENNIAKSFAFSHTIESLAP